VPSALQVACASLASARATRLIVRDDFPPVRWARDQIEQRGPGWLVDLVSCPWCASAHVSAAATALLWLADSDRTAGKRRLAPRVAASALTWGAVWAVSSTLAYWQGEAEDARDQAFEQERMETLTASVGANGKVEA
jgi:hypothetical protein